jgi:hypothetical protein
MARLLIECFQAEPRIHYWAITWCRSESQKQLIQAHAILIVSSWWDNIQFDHLSLRSRSYYEYIFEMAFSSISPSNSSQGCSVTLNIRRRDARLYKSDGGPKRNAFWWLPSETNYYTPLAWLITYFASILVPVQLSRGITIICME